MTDLKERVRSLLRKLRRGSTATRNARQLLRGFDAFGIDLVFDVGANTGQFAREIRDAPPIQRARSNTPCRARRESRHRIAERAAGSEFGTAAQARTEPGVLRRGGRWKEPAPLGVGHACGTHRPTIDPRRRHADEEHAVEARVPRVRGALAGVNAECGAKH